ncbi:hypothetical protein [Sphingobacterium siyangense]|uniref:Uncharacterized protein n=1 Tax=Sphingobacterium siyangense TaxID=459529 RepID=A0A562MKJ6_9SPHI|nr:hypothetical protein [Sphingobacterium siyangense]TWI20358.1 hypothetical protein IQ31_02313 [Sphingobacterium siyangense]
MHPAEQFNKAKAQVFSIYNRDGDVPAYKLLEAYRGSLPITAWYGLKAELDFYTKNKDVFTLDPVFDYGIKCDFTGNIDGVNNCRIDITTNLNFKKLKDYDSIQRKDNRKYKIVVMDKDTGKIADIFDLNFPYDNSGEGRMFDIALFMPSSSGNDGLRYDFHQEIITVGTSDPESDNKFITSCTDWYIPDFEYMVSELPEGINIEDEILKHAVFSSTSIEKSTSSRIMACAQPYFNIFNPHTGEGEWITKIYWKHPVVADYLGDYIETDLSDIF